MEENILVKESRYGKGVFANRDFAKGEPIKQVEGKRCFYSELPFPYTVDYHIQVGKGLYFDPYNRDKYWNHSCDPNAGLIILESGEKLVMVAIKDILKGEEITFDYSTTMAENGLRVRKPILPKKSKRF